MEAKVVSCPTSHGQIYWYRVDRNGVKRRISESEAKRVSGTPSRTSRAGYSRTRERKTPSGSVRGSRNTKRNGKTGGNRRRAPTRAELETWNTFWSQRIQEHLEVIMKLTKLLNHSDTKEITTAACRLHTQWASFVDETKSSQDRLMDQTQRFKLEFRALLPVTEATRCWRDLLTHMVGEVERLKRMRTSVPTVAELIEEWSGEQAEAEEFAACQLPQFLRTPSPELKAAGEKGKKLASLLLTLNKRTPAEELVSAFDRLSREHQHATYNLITVILPTLHMSEELRKFSATLLEHEYREAIWAHQLILKLSKS